MKKNLNSLFWKGKIKKAVGVLLLLMFCLVPLLAEPCGDVDSNGGIDIVDALLIAQHYVGLNPQNFDEGAADANGDGTIDIVDALLIAQYYVGLITELPGCVILVTPTPGSMQKYELQAETEATWNDAVIESTHAGYTGSGFVNTANAAGTWIEWSFDLLDPGNAICEFRYACASEARSMDLSINGSVVTRLDFPASGDWTIWAIETATVSLAAGSNTIRLTSIAGTGAPNIDKLDITTGSGVPSPDPTPIATATPPPTPVTTDPPNVTPPPGVKGYININDPVPGWASMSGGTTGGGTNLGSAVTVNSLSALNSEASGSSAKIILVEPGTYNGSFEPGANKTIIGTAPGVTIQGKILISGSDKNNIIVRNIAVRGDYCSSDDECRSGPDAVYIGNGAHHVWFDHCDVADGQDGNFDITKEGDYVTISWTKLWYTKEKPHAQCSLIAGSDGETQSRGKLQITYMNCWWGSFIRGRQPRGRFGKIHCLNNYHNSDGGIHGVGKEMSLIAENNYYDTPGISIFKDMGSPTGWKGIGNEGSANGMNDSRGSVFTIPYNYTAMPASQVKAAVTASVGGAGTTVQLQM